MRQRFVAVLAAASLFSAVPAVAPVFDGSPVAAAYAKSCSGYVKAQINGQTKCLRRGQFCARAADRQYRRYGFRCTRYDSKVGRYRLT